MQLLAEGKSTKEVACHLNLSVKTAETHRSNVMRKLGLHSVSELVLYAVRNSIVQVAVGVPYLSARCEFRRGGSSCFENINPPLSKKPTTVFTVFGFPAPGAKIICRPSFLGVQMSSALSGPNVAPVASLAHTPSHTQDGHVVQLYANDGFLIDVLSRFIGGALAVGDAAVVIATTISSRRAGEAAVDKRSGYGKAAIQGRYIVLDATETLPKVMVQGLVDDARFREIIGEVLSKARKFCCPQTGPRRGVWRVGCVAMVWRQAPRKRSGWSNSGMILRRATLSVCFAHIRSRVAIMKGILSHF